MTKTTNWNNRISSCGIKKEWLHSRFAPHQQIRIWTTGTGKRDGKILCHDNFPMWRLDYTSKDLGQHRRFSLLPPESTRFFNLLHKIFFDFLYYKTVAVLAHVTKLATLLLDLVSFHTPLMTFSLKKWLAPNLATCSLKMYSCNVYLSITSWIISLFLLTCHASLLHSRSQLLANTQICKLEDGII